ncbi:MAG: hypothetical protein KKH04_10715 [Proteobacteria bacterium]|nr:hypothetical protein [Pseudomonadota bacterium]
METTTRRIRPCYEMGPPFRAAYGLYDENSGKYLLKRGPYDVDTAQRKIIAAGLPLYLAHRLSQGI